MSNQSIESKLLIIIDKLKSIENRLSTIEHNFIRATPLVPTHQNINELEEEVILFKPKR